MDSRATYEKECLRNTYEQDAALGPLRRQAAALPAHGPRAHKVGDTLLEVNAFGAATSSSLDAQCRHAPLELRLLLLQPVDGASAVHCVVRCRSNRTPIGPGRAPLDHPRRCAVRFSSRHLCQLQVPRRRHDWYMDGP